MTLDAKNLPYRYCFDDIMVPSREKVTAVIGAWADYIRTDFDTGDVTVPDGKGGWKYWCKAWEL